MSNSYTGADLISDFIAEHMFSKVFLVTGGACAFIVDAIGRNSNTDYVCFQHEQAAAMAADAVWRTTGKLGVTVATSGPGATNLITGIACSWFDSVPSFHITGQVNQSESREVVGANVRQAGFQETDIVKMVSSITKFAKKITSVEDLVESLSLALNLATSGRMGPVLLDVPMNIQKAYVNDYQKNNALKLITKTKIGMSPNKNLIKNFIRQTKRPIVLIGAGVGLSGTATQVQNWCEKNNIPYTSSWGALAYLDRSRALYQGSIGVYGSRHANWAIQSADCIVVLGSRLDNRQRTGNPNGFAPFAKILVVDVDKEELKKYKSQPNYQTETFDLHNVSELLQDLSLKIESWNSHLKLSKATLKNGFSAAVQPGQFNPYDAVRIAQRKFKSNALVVSDCGANLCWTYQAYEPDDSFIFTAGGNSPMGYSLPAAIGAQIANPDKPVYCFIGDGGLQMNIQEIQTLVAYNLPIKIFIQNNFGYGIIKQFQDAYFESRHFATGIGYTIPSFEKIADAYGLFYIKVNNAEEFEKIDIPDGIAIIDIHLPENSLITPKTEMNRFIHDQFPYISDNSISELPFNYPERPSELSGESNPTV